eukprot:scaffold226791_cov19-Tisochrysis_lutea.AAC.1
MKPAWAGLWRSKRHPPIMFRVTSIKNVLTGTEALKALFNEVGLGWVVKITELPFFAALDIGEVARIDIAPAAYRARQALHACREQGVPDRRGQGLA